jgi:hypothetical protein
MTQTKIGAARPTSRIAKFVGNSTLAAGMLVGGFSLLNAGGAQAAIACTPDTAGIYSMSMLTVNSGPNPDKMPPCQISDVAGIASVVAQWDAGVIGQNGEYTYSISTTNGNMFTEVAANMDISGTMGGSVTKTIYSDSLFTTQIGTVTSTGGVTPYVALSDMTLTTVYVKDTWTVDGGTQLNSISNNFKSAPVPGPLPILGAGMAFGYSRKLRARIKASV